MKNATYDEAKWKLVPVEPTPEMLNTPCAQASDRLIYRDMLAAAPAPPTDEQPQQGQCAECGKRACDGWALYCVDCGQVAHEQAQQGGQP